METNQSCCKGTSCLTYLFNLIGIVASIPFMYYIGRPDTFCLQFFTLGLTVLLIAPYVLFILINRFLVKIPCQRKLTCLISLLSVLGAAYAFYDAFFINYAGQNGLYLIIVPLCQIIVAFLLGIVQLKCSKCHK